MSRRWPTRKRKAPGLRARRSTSSAFRRPSRRRSPRRPLQARPGGAGRHASRISPNYDAIIVGAPTRFGRMPSAMGSLLRAGRRPLGDRRAERQGRRGLHLERHPAWRQRDDAVLDHHQPSAFRPGDRRPALQPRRPDDARRDRRRRALRGHDHRRRPGPAPCRARSNSTAPAIRANSSRRPRPSSRADARRSPRASSPGRRASRARDTWKSISTQKGIENECIDISCRRRDVQGDRAAAVLGAGAAFGAAHRHGASVPGARDGQASRLSRRVCRSSTRCRPGCSISPGRWNSSAAC